VPTNWPLLTVRQGREGSFVSFLEEVGLKEFLDQYPIPSLVEWRWLVPQSRIVFPKAFFDDWKNFPNCGPEAAPNHPLDAALWDGQWFIASLEEPLWFVHPLLRPSGEEESVAFQSRSQTTFKTPATLRHENGREISPYVDYFFHWQAFALIDVIYSAERFSPILATPDAHIRVDRLRSILDKTIAASDPQGMLSHERRWGGLSEPMTWMSHYRGFRQAFAFYEMRKDSDHNAWRAGAIGLADHLKISAPMLELAIREKLLVWAQGWRWRCERQDKWCLRAWPHLQRDIALAVEWLEVLSDKDFEHYLRKWTYPDRSQREWAELSVVLPYAFYSNRERFLRIAPLYLDDSPDFPLISEFLKEVDIASWLDRQRKQNAPFRGWVRAFRKMHDEFNPSSFDASPNFQEGRPEDEFALLAIRAETTLRFELDRLGEIDSLPPKKHVLNTYIAMLARRNALSKPVLDEFTRLTQDGVTHLHSKPEDPIASIRNLDIALTGLDRELVQSLLCLALCRNYFAHHHYLDSLLTRSESGRFLLTGSLMATVLLLGGVSPEKAP